MAYVNCKKIDNNQTSKRNAALFMNISAAKSLSDIMKTNLGPSGTYKMLVGGSGDIKLTNDGNILLREMQIQNPTALMIARAAIAQDDITGDGTTSVVLYIGELIKQAEWYLAEGVHPQTIVEGWEVSRKSTLELLETFKTQVDSKDRELLKRVANTSLGTKLTEDLAKHFTEIVVEAVASIRKEKEATIDLFMIEIMHMKHKLTSDSKLIKGLVLDHGSRHPNMPKYAKNCFVLNCNISLEYEKSEINSSFTFSNAEQREKMVAMERKITDDKVRKIIDLKRKVCNTKHKTFAMFNQKGIDPISLEMLANEGILALRRTKRRNAERLQLCCGAYCINSLEELSPECLGFAGSIYEYNLNDEKYTFIEEVKNSFSVTILLKGPSEQAISHINDAVRDGLRSIKNVFEDEAVLHGAGAFEVAASLHLMNKTRQMVDGKAKLGVDSFAQALLIIPKVLAENSGFDPQESVISLQHEHENGKIVGIDITTGKPTREQSQEIYDNYSVKKQILSCAPILSSQLLLVDEIIRAGPGVKSNDAGEY
jgi:T-complex protein 1 subunit zeta